MHADEEVQLGAQATMPEIIRPARGVSTLGVLALLQLSKAALGAPPVNPNGEPTHPNEAEQAEHEAECERNHGFHRIEASY
jgi:hypothetical protein